MITRTLILSLLFAVNTGIHVCAQHGKVMLSGKVMDHYKEGLIGSRITLLKEGVATLTGTCDYDGNYLIGAVDTGVYDIWIVPYGYDSMKTTIRVHGDSIMTKDYAFPAAARHFLEAITIHTYCPRIIDHDNPTKRTFSGERLNQMPR